MKKIFTLLSIIILSFALFGCASEKEISPEKLNEEISSFIIKCKEDGTLTKLEEFWLSGDVKKVDLDSLDGKNGTIKWGAENYKPFHFVVEDGHGGYTVELLYLFAKEYGYKIEVINYDSPNSIVAAIKAGKCDIGGASSSITEERSKAVNFTESHYTNIVYTYVLSNSNLSLNYENATLGVLAGTINYKRCTDLFPNASTVKEFVSDVDALIALRSHKIDAYVGDASSFTLVKAGYDDVVEDKELDSSDKYAFMYQKESNISFVDQIKESFTKTFIDEDRYKLFIEGVKNTLSIELFSIICGSLFGYLLFILFINLKKVVGPLIKICDFILSVTPTIVLLMIIYYIIFGKSSLSAEIVSVLTFTLMFGFTSFNNINNAIKTIDHGQYEASIDIGYSKPKMYEKIIMPQSLSVFMPNYKSSLINLIKATSIVGYISVMDITKIGDLIRGNTFEPYFPLFATALIYFLITFITIMIVNIIFKFMMPSKAKSIRYLKGVEIHDWN